jgi:hypothetical protein
MRRAAVAGIVVAGAILAAGAVWIAGGFGPGDVRPPDAPGPDTHPPAAAQPRRYTFRYEGDDADLPWNRTLWLTLEKRGRPQPVLAAIFVPGEGTDVPVEGVPGTRWAADSEASPNRAIRRAMWTTHGEGVFGDETTIVLPIPPRALVRMSGDEQSEAGEDFLTVVDEEGGARLVASRRPVQALRLAVWDASQPEAKQDWRSWTTLAPARPWICNEVRPGVPLVLAAQVAGRQWVAQRVQLKAGEILDIDTAGAPKGGGTVICDDGGAELLLRGNLPVPPLRLSVDSYRVLWRNVPPGRHAIRRTGGATETIEVADGTELTVK